MWYETSGPVVAGQVVTAGGFSAFLVPFFSLLRTPLILTSCWLLMWPVPSPLPPPKYCSHQQLTIFTFRAKCHLLIEALGIQISKRSQLTIWFFSIYIRSIHKLFELIEPVELYFHNVKPQLTFAFVGFGIDNGFSGDDFPVPARRDRERQLAAYGYHTVKHQKKYFWFSSAKAIDFEKHFFKNDLKNGPQSSFTINLVHLTPWRHFYVESQSKKKKVY